MTLNITYNRYGLNISPPDGPVLSVTTTGAAQLVLAAVGLQGPKGDRGAVGDPAPAGVYVQASRPTTSGPWTWWQTDASGQVIDLIVNDGAA
jgi:hypothetical protein